MFKLKKEKNLFFVGIINTSAVCLLFEQVIAFGTKNFLYWLEVKIQKYLITEVGLLTKSHSQFSSALKFTKKCNLYASKAKINAF